MFANPPAQLRLHESLLVGSTKPESEPIVTSQVDSLLPTPRDTPIEEIRLRFARDGYVYMKKLITPSIVHEARRTYFEWIKQSGILHPTSQVEDGVFIGGAEARETFGVTPGSTRSGLADYDPAKSANYLDLCIAAQKSDWFHKFSTTPELVDFVRELTQWGNPLLLKRQMLRAALPGCDGVPVHYDHLFFRHGPPTFITCWTPFDDTTPHKGGLMYLSDSKSIGEKMEQEFSENAQNLTDDERKSAFNTNMMAGGILHPDASAFAAGQERKWLMADYEAGDVVFHNPFIIHASCVNQDPGNTIMIHTDIRFVNPEEPFDTRWTEHWMPGDGL